MARDRSAWRRRVLKLLRKPAQEAGVGESALRRAVMVEFGLYALSAWEPEAAAIDGWAILKGFDFRPHGSRKPEVNDSVRWLIGELKKDQDWFEALAAYEEFPEHLRLFAIKAPEVPPVRRELSTARERVEVYAEALSGPPPHRREPTRLAEAGKPYVFTVGGVRHRVRLPHWLIPSPIAGHASGRCRRRVRVNWSSLLATAKRMDAADSREGRYCDWYGRIHDLELHLRGARGLCKARRLTIEDLVQLVGMPAVGKTSLLTVLAVWAAQHKYTLTLVLGDVLAVLNMVADLNRYQPGAAAPILGASTRGQHLRQLHRPPDPTTVGAELLRDDRLAWVSTACTLQGSLPDLGKPFALSDAPCDGRLEEVAEDSASADEKRAERQVRACPLFYKCGRHAAARALVDAPIWVATAPSLLHCRVPGQLTEESKRYLELAWERSDAIAFDEADRVQIQLDQAFSPTQTLAGPGKDAYLDEVRPLFEQHNRSTHGRHLASSSTVRDWSIAISAASMLVARLRALLAEHHHVRDWLREEYFNEWRLGAQLAAEISRRPSPSEKDKSKEQESADDRGEATKRRWRIDRDLYDRWWAVLREWLTDPGGRYDGDDARVASLRAISARGYDDTTRVTQQLIDWLQGMPDVIVSSGEPRRRLAIRFQVAMTVALLAKHLEHLTRYCWEVESETGAEGMSSSLVHRPPPEYLPLVPESPMGNLLGFQYREDETAPTDRIGTLSFFRCSGIGRSLLLNLPRLFPNRGDVPQPGPGVLLLSATSWAGESPRYDVQAPVTGILTSRRAEEVPVEERISCFYLPSRTTTPSGKPYDRTVSGKQGDERTEALCDIVADLCSAKSSPRGARPSTLESIRDDLEPGRRRLMLLVGNYQEAKLVHHKLIELRPEWAGQIVHMVPDDSRGTHHWEAGALARSRISTLARHRDVWIMITPMLAIERGHNILNDDHVAALGAALYLVRPHLHPEDLSYHIESMNRWGVEEIRTGFPSAGLPDAPLGERAMMFQRIAHRRWTDRLAESLRYAHTEPDSQERRAMDWTNIPPLNQIAGRMLRGAARARIYFCDGAFAPHSDDSILLGMYRALREAMTGPDAEIARPLYTPLMHGLRNLLEKHRGDL
ncbi:pPIWI_RE_Z domain-containing protein [Streptomyces sp. NPDC002851]